LKQVSTYLAFSKISKSSLKPIYLTFHFKTSDSFSGVTNVGTKYPKVTFVDVFEFLEDVKKVIVIKTNKML